MKKVLVLTSIFYLLLCCHFVLPAYADDKSKPSAAVQLGWVPGDQNMCGGYYQDPLKAFSGAELPPLEKTPFAVDADKVYFEQEGVSIIAGNVVVTQPGRSLHADKAHLNRKSGESGVSSVDLYGNVKLREPDKLVVADRGHVELKKHSGYLTDVLYRIMLRSAKVVTGVDTMPLNAWGKADKAEQENDWLINFNKATYTTCAPTTNTWQLSAGKIHLDRDEGIGTARNVVMRYQGVPIFYTPYLRFPIDDRRQSGFLFPSLSSSSQSGFILGIPYYLNLAPNYDALITPTYYTKRGLQINGQFRYLTHSSSGAFNGSFLPSDNAFNNYKKQQSALYQGLPSSQQPAGLSNLLNASINRGFISWQDQRTFAPRWSSGVNYNWASDDYYLADFTPSGVLTSNQLFQQGNVTYAGDIWRFSTQINSYQTLHPINQPATANPYNSLPEIDLNGYLPDQKYGLSYTFINQVVYFQRPNNPGQAITSPSTGRINILPGVSWPIQRPEYYFTPQLQLSMRSYSIWNQLSGFNSNPHSVIPIFDIDSGLYFDRNISWLGKGYQQTLEPRLFYLFVPYVNQTSFPLFDSGLNPFTYDFLFVTNRFSGYDRVGDANQVSFALTTRVLDDGNAEKFRASVGEIVYFRNRSVNLCNPVDLATSQGVAGATCANPQAVPGITSPTEPISPIAGLLRYQFNPRWSSSANVAWDPTQNTFINGGVNLQYQPQPNHILNLNYSYIQYGDIINPTPNATQSNLIPATSSQNSFNRIGFSFAWPISERWSTVGGVTYALNRGYTQLYFYGLQYDNCCWAIRAVAGRAFYALDSNNNPMFNTQVFVQFLFKGLSTVGNANPSSFLMGGIPGYQDTFQAAPRFS